MYRFLYRSMVMVYLLCLTDIHIPTMWVPYHPQSIYTTYTVLWGVIWVYEYQLNIIDKPLQLSNIKNIYPNTPNTKHYFERLQLKVTNMNIYVLIIDCGYF